MVFKEGIDKRKSKDFRWCLKGVSLKKHKRESKDFRWCLKGVSLKRNYH